MLCLDRRQFLKISAISASASLLSHSSSAASQTFSNLKPMTDGIKPITDEERAARIEKARKLMVANRIDAIFLEPGSSLYYYTGVNWSLSERMFALIIPARGELAWICPAFEEQRARELIRFGTDIRTWEEDESPYQRVAQIFKDRTVNAGTIGMEERVRFFLVNGIQKESLLQNMSARIQLRPAAE
jgi:Xaa-Pro aminopeptidase